MADRFNIVVKQNATYNLSMTVKAQGTGIPVDLSDYTGKGEVKLAYGDTSAVVSFTVTFLTPRTSGQVIFTLPYTDTAILDSSKEYVYDVTIKSPDGIVTRLSEGILTVSPGVTVWL